MKKVFLIFIWMIFAGMYAAQAQSYAFGLKVGPTVGFQKWSGFDVGALYRYHGALFIESAPEENLFSVYAQAGYHLKGSALRYQRGFTIGGNPYNPPAQEFIFKNIALILGAKKKYSLGGGDSRLYYMIGVRGEYTVRTNLAEYHDPDNISSLTIFPFPEYVNKWNYGVTAGGGVEVPFRELFGMTLELTVHPDFSRQYFQPPIQNVRDPFTGQNRTIEEREIRNIAIELSIGFRFLHKIEYID